MDYDLSGHNLVMLHLPENVSNDNFAITQSEVKYSLNIGLDDYKRL